MVNIWGRNLKAQKVAPAHPDPSHGPGVGDRHLPFSRASHHMPLNFSSESNIEVTILEWETKCDQNTTAILVLEAPYAITQPDFV